VKEKRVAVDVQLIGDQRNEPSYQRPANTTVIDGTKWNRRLKGVDQRTAHNNSK